ncbi:MAG: hypothetical protein A3J30_04255 [Candidatus Wildermuthbacteria bacterium RIFCSPLOWO2_02_FULL_47_9c]|uniref:Uncharacterized protein n=1 Tax=Candidatus Wildermuthbacteria bacterium RIFCSPLOWO2_02_FULL_47_9c TaxID=1802466 RepID=A0A1G2RVE4_9BACT|nr:MAG: hypothetical protein A2109_02420 [Candidatus Wildermuthbacteria bacterium GWA1_49_26]OHA66321.1 MAG: hypothetical protein A2674_02650 [Candidatus Wildermuthbacteria bacterium RIFCSPHIGHO2_01_FULL_50_47]OHA69919.1 MAG: hypothetical protein A3D63_01665 [Candidatus Wildermuthbacteria bacterium RIFCSPHIGHO2_02_FULL_49_17]OHA72528.1 MAG: hypothetical protein A3E08_02430 [Candidatus Wildermuthbacteria bacterium RIFCSPHIGHO2_12_FULL_49_13]OHA74409.1 MAG: hypothetical protein A3B28_03130 [Candi
MQIQKRGCPVEPQNEQNAEALESGGQLVQNTSGHDPYRDGKNPRRINRLRYTEGLSAYNEHPVLPGEGEEGKKS